MLTTKEWGHFRGRNAGILLLPFGIHFMMQSSGSLVGIPPSPHLPLALGAQP